MRSFGIRAAVVAVVADIGTALPQYDGHTKTQAPMPQLDYHVSLGTRPYYLVDNMTQSPLKDALTACENGPFRVTRFSIGHRGGGTLQFPEETVQSTTAGARMGAGILECDVSFTADRGLVCRHSLCDLHTTTDILLRPELAAKCTVPFQPANDTSPATALCCTSDITTAEFRTLCGKQDGFNASATTPQTYQHGTPTWRTELYDTCGTPMTLDEYITIVDALPGRRDFTPELKTPPPQVVPMPFHGYTQEQYARDMLATFVRRGIDPARVWPQSFHPPDIFQWLREFPDMGKQAIYLDASGDDPDDYATAAGRLPTLYANGVNIISPPMNYLLAVGPDGRTVVPAPYALAAKAAGLDIIAWTFERSGPLATVEARRDFYFSSIANVTHHDGQYMDALDVLARQVGIKALFSDWSATSTYYANCFGLPGPRASDYRFRVAGNVTFSPKISERL